ncbi:hypothetical protein ACJJIQ_08255 [Microbulbifer sp. ANSA003]|uniref:hypothetical protein n=1 Tax=Microbulbifer sp. ANSA003 TaxID=3243360 RepID=UPI0040437E18
MKLKKLRFNSNDLAKVSGYLFFIQFILFVGFIILLPNNIQFFKPSSTIQMGDFLIALGQTPNEFIILKLILLALRTCYALSFVFIAVLFWENSKVASAALISFTLVSVAIINIAQLLGLALIPIANDYTSSLALGDDIRTISLETSAFGIYVAQELLDTFVNTVTFNGIFVCLFAISCYKVELKYTKWLIPIMMILPYNRFFDLPAVLSLVSGLLNVIVTAIYFLLMGFFLLKMSSPETSKSTV